MSSFVPSFHDKITAYYSDYPDSSQYIGKSDETALDDTTLAQGVQDLKVSKDKEEAYIKSFLYIGGPETLPRKKSDDKQDASPSS